MNIPDNPVRREDLERMEHAMDIMATNIANAGYGPLSFWRRFVLALAGKTARQAAATTIIVNAEAMADTWLQYRKGHGDVE